MPNRGLEPLGCICVAKTRKKIENHLHALTQAVADVVCWSQVLDELLCRDVLPEEARHAQVNLTQTELDNAWRKIREVILDAQTFATQSQNASTRDG